MVDCYTTTRAHRQAALYHVAIRCGLRFGELIGLRWQDVNLDLQELRVVGQLQDQKRKRAKTRRSHRTVPLSPNLVGVLRAHWLNQRSERSVSPATWNAAQLVFCSEAGTPIGESNLRRQFVGFQRRAGLSALCPKCQATGLNGGRICGTCQGQKCVGIFRVHDMRHTYAAIAIAADVDIFSLSRRMGHESITTTANTYGHLYKGKTDDADAIDQLLQREGD